MRKYLLILLIPVLFASCAKVIMIRNMPTENGGYLFYGKDNSRNFYVPIAISDSLKLLWETSTYGSYNNSSIIAYDKYILIHDLSGYITCMDKNIGTELSTLNYSGTIYSTPAIYKSRLFYIVNNGEETNSTAYYYDMKDGMVINQTVIEGSFTNQILKNDKAFYAISDKGVIYKFNFGGVLEWTYDTGMQVLSTPAMFKESIYFASTGGEIVVFDFTRKEITARTKLESGVYSGIVLKDGLVYTGDALGNLYCLGADDLLIRWKASTGNKITGLPVTSGRYVYVTNLFGTVSCFDALRGTLKWKNNFGGAPITTPILFDNILIQPNLDSYMYLINVTDGKLIKRIKTGGRMKLTPVYYEGILYVGYDKGNIAAYEIKEVK